MKTTFKHLKKVRRLTQMLLCAFFAIMFPHATVMAETTDKPSGANKAIFTANFNEDGVTDNILAAKYNGTYYVMEKPRDDGKRYAQAVIDTDKYGNNLLVDKTSAETFKVEGKRVTVSNGSYWVNSMLTEDGYIVDKYRIDGSHGFATASMSDTQFNEKVFFWNFSWEQGLYNNDTYGTIYLVIDGDDLYFDITPYEQKADATHIKAERYSMGCQHPNMQHVATVPATCKKNGNGEYWYCPDCAADYHAAYFSEAVGLNDSYSPPIILSYGAIDNDHDGVCDDCGKNMPVFRKVTKEEKILVGGKYILITQVGDKYYAATTGTEEYGEILPAMEVVPTKDGSFKFMDTAAAMMIELQFAADFTVWGNGIRYGFLTKFDNKPMTFNPGGDSFYFEEYDMRGSKYGFYVGLEPDGTAKIHSAFSPDTPIRSYVNGNDVIFTLKDFSSDEAYTASNVYLYRLTDVGTVGSNTYNMTNVKSETDYEIIKPGGSNAEGGTNVTGIADALTQTAVNEIVETFATEHGISNSEITVAVSANIEAVDYVVGESATFEVTPTATVSANGITANYPISDNNFDGVSSMTVTIYSGDINPAEVIHENEDGTNECFYQEWSEEVQQGGEEAFYQLFDGEGNSYVSFPVTSFSKVRLLKTPGKTSTLENLSP